MIMLLQGPVLIIRFFEGELSPRPDQPDQQRLQTAMTRLIDVRTIVNLFPPAIREISKRCSQR